MKGMKKMYYYIHPYQTFLPYYSHVTTFPYNNQFGYERNDYYPQNESLRITDQGPNPFTVNISQATIKNNNYRTAIWTGEHLQVTLMSINPGDDIGLEIHPDTDQFLRLEEGNGIVRMGKSMDNLNFERRVSKDSAIMVPAGTWHNVINTGYTPLKLYSIYAPPHHPRGTVEKTKAEAMIME